MSRGASDLTGILLLDKPAGPTSHDLVAAVRRLTGQRRIGHTGTLDPFATGLLPLCLGRATRLARFLSGDRKSYRARLRFGFETDTHDRTGRPMSEPAPAELERERLAALCRAFLGKQEQEPPAFSAKRIQGERAYHLARAGAAVAPASIVVEIHRLELLDVEGEEAIIEVDVSSGTYIRALARDLGRRWGVGAHLEELRRLAVGPLSVEEALGLDEIEKECQRGGLERRLLGPGSALAALPQLVLPRRLVVPLSHGRLLPWHEAEVADATTLRLHHPDGRFLAVAELRKWERGWQLKPLVVWAASGESPDTA